MKGRILTSEAIDCFKKYLREEEKSENTIEKYLRDVRAFAAYLKSAEITKEAVIAYKNKLLSENYAVRSINSMLASLNNLFVFLGWADCRVKSIKVQRQIYCPEEKELTKAEYMRLVNTAKQKGNERLNLILQTICGTGIRVSELQYITLDAVKRGEVGNVLFNAVKNTSEQVAQVVRKDLLRIDRAAFLYYQPHMFPKHVVNVGRIRQSWPIFSVIAVSTRHGYTLFRKTTWLCGMKEAVLKSFELLCQKRVLINIVNVG